MNLEDLNRLSECSQISDLFACQRKRHIFLQNMALVLQYRPIKCSGANMAFVSGLTI